MSSIAKKIQEQQYEDEQQQQTQQTVVIRKRRYPLVKFSYYVPLLSWLPLWE